ncbi:MAG: hypothetical protein LBT60_01525 [Oscillospiraceae bacterium]|jgi:hypothetical protein|nr:hypothetical protein [Oscillospiraceae bacterium]
MDTLPTRLSPDRTPTAVAGATRPLGAGVSDFTQNIRDATRQTQQAQTPPSLRPQSVSPLTADLLRAGDGDIPGVTPLTPAELNRLQTDQQLQARQLLNNYAARLAAPANMADYPATLVTYAGQLAAQTNRAGFSMPESSARGMITPRRRPETRAISPVEPVEEGDSIAPR